MFIRSGLFHITVQQCVERQHIGPFFPSRKGFMRYVISCQFKINPFFLVWNLRNRKNNALVWPAGGSSRRFFMCFCAADLGNVNRSQRNYHKINIIDAVKGLSGQIIVLIIVRQTAQAETSCCWSSNVVLFICWLDICFNVAKI